MPELFLRRAATATTSSLWLDVKVIAVVATHVSKALSVLALALVLVLALLLVAVLALIGDRRLQTSRRRCFFSPSLGCRDSCPRPSLTALISALPSGGAERARSLLRQLKRPFGAFRTSFPMLYQQNVHGILELGWYSRV